MAGSSHKEMSGEKAPAYAGGQAVDLRKAKKKALKVRKAASFLASPAFLSIYHICHFPRVRKCLSGLSFVKRVLRGQRCFNISVLTPENVVLSDGLSGQDVNPQDESLPTTLEVWTMPRHVVVC